VWPRFYYFYNSNHRSTATINNNTSASSIIGQWLFIRLFTGGLVLNCARSLSLLIIGRNVKVNGILVAAFAHIQFLHQ
jgi:hypothetical protein